MSFTENYSLLVARLQEEIRSARIKASLSANVHLLSLYWKIGNAIAEQETSEGWGAKVVEQLAKDLRKQFPDMKGISPRNLRYMRNFAVAYPQFVQQIASPTPGKAILQDRQSGQNQMLQQPAATFNGNEFLQQPAAQLPWFHICTILDKVKDPAQRLFYMQQAAENGWSRNVMVHQIESGLYNRKGAAITNFDATLTKTHSDLAKELLKDPYKFDFLSLGEEYVEKDLENALVDHITKFLLELGAGFSFVGRQYHLEVGGDDFYIDLLFYHFKLRCFIVVELKTGKFIPEYASKLNFYLNVVDDILKHEADQPSIGILICKERNRVIAEYALRGINKPIGVSEYQLVEALPKQLKGKLPSIEEIENELTEAIL